MDILEPEVQVNAFTKRKIGETRHPKELRIYALAVVANIITVIVVISWFVGEVNSISQQLSVIAEERGVAIEEVVATDLGGIVEEIYYNPKNQERIQLYLLVITLFLFIMLILELYYAEVRSRAIKVTSRQFSEIYDMAVKYAAMLGLKKIPEIYLVQENGVLNAYASNVLRKRYIIINADLLEIAYRQYNDFSSIGFVLAHEMAHIKLKHVSIWNRYTVMLTQILPIIGPALSRVREYSCDRLAQVVSENDGMEAMMALSIGKHLYKKTDITDYIDSTNRTAGFWMWVVNLSSSHPVLPKRMRALKVPTIPGKIF